MGATNVNLGLREVATGNGIQSITQTVLLPRTYQNNTTFQMFVPSPPLYFLDWIEHQVTYRGPPIFEFEQDNHCNLNSAPDISGEVVTPAAADPVEDWLVEEGYEWGKDFDIVLPGFDFDFYTVFVNPGITAALESRTWKKRYYPGKYLVLPDLVSRVGLYNNQIDFHVFTELLDDFGEPTIRVVDNRMTFRWVPAELATEFVNRWR